MGGFLKLIFFFKMTYSIRNPKEKNSDTIFEIYKKKLVIDEMRDPASPFLLSFF